MEMIHLERNESLSRSYALSSRRADTYREKAIHVGSVRRKLTPLREIDFSCSLEDSRRYVEAESASDGPCSVPTEEKSDVASSDEPLLLLRNPDF